MPERVATSVDDLELEDYHLRIAGREWSILHSKALITFVDEQHFLGDPDRLPYGLMLWPSAVALAHEIAGRAPELRGARVLELGAGTGAPGIVASALGAQVTQTDKHELALQLCRRNGERNCARGIEYRVADWAHWSDDRRYDWIVGADILYAETTQPNLRKIFEANLAPGGRMLLSDPLRLSSIRFLETLDGHGWTLTMSKWTIGEGEFARTIGVFELRSSMAGTGNP
jgi:predicted nicotinamide N-methyase